MNSLTVGIAILGGLVLAGVIAYNTWTTRKQAPRVAKREHESGDASEVASNDRIEPALNSQFSDEKASETLSKHAQTAPIFEVNDFKPSKRNTHLDALIDVIAVLNLDSPIAGEAVLAALPSTRRIGSKFFDLEAKVNDDSAWKAPVSGENYESLQIGIQMASRAGALNDIEFSEFAQLAQSLAEHFNAQIQLPDMREAISSGRELDAFASSHDAQLSLTLRARQVAWSPGYVQQHAARQGLIAGAFAGRLVLPSSEPHLPPILALNFDSQAALADEPEQTALRHFDLVLDVPQVERSEQPYRRLREVAIALAASMDGLITDDQGRIISLEAMDAIGSDLEHLYDQLDARDLSAGSAQARRLFS